MSSFTSAMVQGGDPTELVRACCQRLTQGGSRHNFGVVYLSDLLASDAEGIVEGLKLGTGIRSWVGGIAMGVCGSDGECFGEPAVAVLAGSLPEDSFLTFDPAEEDDAIESVMSSEWVRSHAPRVALVHADPRSPEVMSNIQEIGVRCFVLGGLVSSRSRHVHIADRILEGGLSGVLFSPQVGISTQLSQGCRPVGPRRTVTRGEAQLLEELDHRNAVSLLAEDLAADAAGRGEAPGQSTGGLHVAITVPGDDARDYLVRNLLGLSPQQHALLVGDTMRVGQSVMFCRRDAPSAEADLREMLRTLKRRLSGPPKGAIYVSCLARGPNLFARPDLETGLIREILGEFPMAGFFANGEFFRDRVYGYTGVLTVFT